MTYFSQQIPALIFAAGLGAMVANPTFAQADTNSMGHETSHRHGKMMEQHHDRLHQALKLTAEQEPAWKKLMDTEQGARSGVKTKPTDPANLTVPERAELRLERAKAHLEQMTAHVAALKSFYQALTAEQKKIFEDFHSKQHAGMRHKSPPPPTGSEKPAAKP